MPQTLTLQAILIGRAKTSSEHGHVLVSLKIGQHVLPLTLTPEQASMFPELTQTVPHPTERKAQTIAYNPAPSYTLTIAVVEPQEQAEEPQEELVEADNAE